MSESTFNLPDYLTSLLNSPPSYHAGRQDHENLLTLVDRLGPQFSGTFVKHSRGGNTLLRLSAQEDGASLPVYGSGALVEGTVELTKTEGVTQVEVKIEGKLDINEAHSDFISLRVLGGDILSSTPCLETALLWKKDLNDADCPSSIQFSIQLPTTFTHAEKTYPLPPTFNVNLSGLPGFTVTINYSVSAIISKHNPHLKFKALGANIGSTIVSTPFIYYPRSRPSRGIPSPLISSINGFEITPEWHVLESHLRSKNVGRPDIVVKLYTPALRVFSITQPIPFYLTLESSAVSLTAFLPFSPTARTSGPHEVMRLQLMRRATVDVGTITTAGVKTDIWRVDQIGEGTFRLVANDYKRISYSGEISTDPAFKIPGFKCPRLSINDFILFTVSPSDPEKSPFQDLREIIPIYLSTDPSEDDETRIAPRRASISSAY